jgi:DNA-directed RNA polymerase specialized sigma24 family protein
VEKGAAVNFEATDDEQAMSLEDMSLVLDKSVSGVNQYIARILKKVRSMTEDPRLGSAIDQAAADYARYMAKWLEDPSVETDLMMNLDELRNLDGFRYYLNDVMLEPALAEMRREGLQKAAKKLEALNLPPTALEIVTRTVKNQLTGRSKSDVRAVQKALTRTFPEGADEAYNNYLRMASDIEAAAEPAEGALAVVALALYNSIPESKKKSAFISAIEMEDGLNIG